MTKLAILVIIVLLFVIAYSSIVIALHIGKISSKRDYKLKPGSDFDIDKVNVPYWPILDKDIKNVILTVNWKKEKKDKGDNSQSPVGED